MGLVPVHGVYASRPRWRCPCHPDVVERRRPRWSAAAGDGPHWQGRRAGGHRRLRDHQVPGPQPTVRVPRRRGPCQPGADHSDRRADRRRQPTSGLLQAPHAAAPEGFLPPRGPLPDRGPEAHPRQHAASHLVGPVPAEPGARRGHVLPQGVLPLPAPAPQPLRAAHLHRVGLRHWREAGQRLDRGGDDSSGRAGPAVRAGDLPDEGGQLPDRGGHARRGHALGLHARHRLPAGRRGRPDLARHRAAVQETHG